MSEIERLILSRDFPYLQPYFYNHPWALRCELGTGDCPSVRMRNARERAREIYAILFPEPADAVIFNYRMEDWSGTGPAEAEALGLTLEEADDLLEYNLRCETSRLRFLQTMQNRCRHAAVRDLPVCGDPDEESAADVRRHRIVCWTAGAGLRDRDLIRRQLEDEGLDIGLVSFANECILSVYDDRGCDVVFSGPEKFREFYPRLEPFFLPYDVEEMKKRFARSKARSF